MINFCMLLDLQSNYLIRNKYLEAIAEESSKEMIKVLLRYGETGVVDEESLKERCK